MMVDIEQKIAHFISLGYEDQHWDFKREWYTDKASMLHDILCMANSADEQDSYIIIGVEDDSHEVVGVENDPKRRTTQMLNDFLRSVQFSGGSRPEVRVDAVHMSNHQIDVITIENSDYVPFTLTTDYRDNSSNKTVHCGNVYTRVHDSNTPIDKTADQRTVDGLYKKRLHINSDPIDKLSYALDDLDSWKQSGDINGQFYYTHNTNIQIRLINEDRLFKNSDFLCKIWPSKSAAYETAQLVYNDIIIKEIQHAGLDNYRIDLVRPECEYINVSKASGHNPDYRKYYYITRRSIIDKFNKFLLKTHYTCGQSEFMLDRWLKHVIYFSNDNEKILFDNYIKSLRPQYLLGIIDETTCGFTPELDLWQQNDIDDYKSTLTIRQLYDKWSDYSSWEYRTISDLGAIVGGGTPPTRKPEFFNGNIPWITPDDLSSFKGRYISHGARNITTAGLRSSSATILPKGTVLFSSRAPIGYTAIAKNDLCTNQGFKSIVPYCKHDSLFIFYLLRLLGRKIENYASGATFKEISGSTLGGVSMPIPCSQATRNNISYYLSNIDSAIENTDLLSGKLADFITFLYNYWFVQLDFPDESGRPYKSSGGKMVYNDQLKQEIPEGWECKKLTDLFDFVRGTEVGADAYADKKISDSYIRFWRVRDVGDDCKTWIDGNANNLTIVKPGDVVITLDGTVGKIGIDLDGAISGGLRYTVDHTGIISNATIYTILQSDYVQESLKQYVSGRGSILAHASGALQHLAIPYDKNIFSKFQNTIQPMFDLMINCKEESKQLVSLRDWLLPMLMNGQVEIKE